MLQFELNKTKSFLLEEIDFCKKKCIESGYLTEEEKRFYYKLILFYRHLFGEYYPGRKDFEENYLYNYEYRKNKLTELSIQ